MLRRARPGARRAAAACVLVCLAVLAPPPAAAEPAAERGAPAFAQAARAVVDPQPAPYAVVPAGAVTVTALLAGVAPGAVGTITVNGQPAPTTVTAEPGGLRVSAPATVAHGGNPVLVRAATTEGAVLVERSWQIEASAATVDRLAGDDRIATAVAIAQRLVPDGATTGDAFLARADDFADAVAAAPPATALGAPVLLTPPDALHDVTATELQRLLSADGTVHLLGGEAALSRDVAVQVTLLGFRVVRHAGPDRYATAAELAALVPGRGDPDAADARSLGAVVARGDLAWPALLGGVVAATQGRPLLLTPSDALPQGTREELREAGDVLVLGAVGDGVRAELSALPGIRPAFATAEAPDALARETVTFLAPTAAALLTAEATVADALAAGPLAAALRAPLVPVAGPRLSDAAYRTVAASGPATVLALGGTAAVADSAVADAVTARLDGLDGPGATLEPEAGTTLDPLAFSLANTPGRGPLATAAFHVTLAGREVPGTTTVEGPVARWQAGRLPDVPREVPLDVVVTGVLVEGAHARHVLAAFTHIAVLQDVAGPNGFVIAGGTSEVIGSGPLRRFTIEVEPGTGWEPQDVAAIAEAWLLDPVHGWASQGTRSLQRVDDAAAAHIRVVLAFPATVDRFCGAVGLGTGGRLSCWDGRRAMLNLDRWNTAVPHFSEVDRYRGYLVNHEVGHGLGLGHQGCPGAGQLAPVMLQQSKFLNGCVANPYPYP